MTNFSRELEVRIKELKGDFVAITQWEAFCLQDGGGYCHDRLAALQEGYRSALRELRTSAAHADTESLPSLLAIPTVPLTRAEMRMHRIWLGGPLPAMAAEALRQWQCALDASAGADYALALWVWDAHQLRDDPSFLRTPGPQHRIGSCVAGGARLEVFSLYQLASARAPTLLPVLDTMHSARQYVNLADFFRLLVLHQYGGIYLDVDIMPYRAAPLFLACPEVPDYVRFSPTPHHVCWMNLVDDENGLLVAKRANPALADMLVHMTQRLLQPGLPDPHQATYAVWHAQLGRSFASYHQLAAAHSVLHDDTREAVVSGVLGMRLLVDALNGEARPLSDAERSAYLQCVQALEQRKWRLDDPLDLGTVAQLTSTLEVPRMAYAAQLRAEPASCHYYSFLSDDESLDRVNALFGAYLLARNAQRIAQGDFWLRTQARPRNNYPRFEPRTAADRACQRC